MNSNSGTGVPPVYSNQQTNGRDARSTILLCVLFSVFGLLSSSFADTTNYFYPTNSIPIPRPVITFTNDLYRVFPTNLIISGGPVATNVVPPAQVKVTLVASSLNPTGPFWVRADVANISSVSKVTFVVDGANYHDESIPPYFMCGDNSVTPTLCALSNGTHTIIARAYTNATLFVLSQPLTITVSQLALSTPFNLVALATSPTNVVLTWRDTNSFELGFHMERSIGTTNGFTNIAAIAANELRLEDTHAPPGTNIWYRVRAFN